jgi:hypothetical protein
VRVGCVFFSYKYARRDNFLSILTSIFAVGVAFSPTKPSGGDTTWTTWLHFICAFLFFLTLAYFAYFIFTLPPLPKEQREPLKRLRNKIYRICGITIVVCLVLSPIFDRVLSEAVRNQIHPLFWLESIAVWAFSFSWLLQRYDATITRATAQAPVRPEAHFCVPTATGMLIVDVWASRDDVRASQRTAPSRQCGTKRDGQTSVLRSTTSMGETGLPSSPQPAERWSRRHTQQQTIQQQTSPAKPLPGFILLADPSSVAGCPELAHNVLRDPATL